MKYWCKTTEKAAISGFGMMLLVFMLLLTGISNKSFGQQESNISFPLVVFERKFSVISMMEDKDFILVASRLLDEKTEVLEFERGEGGRKILCRIDLTTLLCNTMMVYAEKDEMADHRRWLNRQARPLGNNQWLLPPAYRNLHLIFHLDEPIENNYYIMVFKPYERLRELMDNEQRKGYDNL